MKDLYYRSTRSNGEQLSFAQAVVRGIAPDGGLYVPSYVPKMDLLSDTYKDLSYQALAKEVLSRFATDFTEEELAACVDGAYDEKFRSPEIAPVVSCDKASFIELYHGKTLAFKDMALSILPYFLKTSAKKLNTEEKIVILTATSGDTGKAALEGFADIDGVEIIVFYPTDGVSDVQKRQMTTQVGDNVHVFGIHGNFDDAQSGVKAMFTDEGYKAKLKENGYVFSSANSINIGRLVPQIVYYIASYYKLVNSGKVALGDEVNVLVPTGNFGNILAAYYAKEMGLPVKNFICASNSNNVLADFFETGKYDLDRDFLATVSPSMDILISSNLERFLFELCQDDQTVAGFMNDLKSKGSYEITADMKEKMSNFYGGYADDTKTVKAIEDLYKKYDYVADTHTAVAYQVYLDYVEKTGDDTQTLIASTASPFKFTRSVLEGMGENTEGLNDFELVKVLSEKADMEIPEPVRALDEKPVLHEGICDKSELSKVVMEVLK